MYIFDYFHVCLSFSSLMNEMVLVRISFKNKSNLSVTSEMKNTIISNRSSVTSFIKQTILILVLTW